MTKHRIKILFIVLVALVFAAFFLSSTSAQKRRDEFLHSTAAHKKIDCASCHKAPTANWASARAFPDVADYPGHASCVQCHRSDFFRSNRPAICSICHTNVSPRGEARFAFPVRSRSREFSTVFPHNVHQDIIAAAPKSLREERLGVAVAHFVKASFKFADDPPKPQYNNCTICHKTAAVLPQFAVRALTKERSLAPPAAEDFTPGAGFFKDAPAGHATCFSCHYQNQKPVRTDCASCHQLAPPYFASNTVRRYSLKFDHQSTEHVKDCTTCHVRITQISDLKMLNDADVPLLTCTNSSCHAVKLKEEVDKREESLAAKQTVFQCNYCHTTAIGSYDIPVSHRRR